MWPLLLVLVTACWGGTQTAPPLPPPQPSEPTTQAPASAFRSRTPRNGCQQTIDGMAEKLRPEFLKSGIPEQTVDELVEAAIESCRSMDWSPDLLACYDGVADANELNGCQKLMTTEQSDDISRRMMEVVSRMSSLPPPPPPQP